MTKPPKPTRAMKIAELCNIHGYFCKSVPQPLSETAKRVLQEIEEHILGIIQRERNLTQTNQTQLEPTLTETFIPQYPEGY